MKNLLILATMLLTFGFANAQMIIYKKDPNYYSDQWIKVGKYDNGVIYKKDPNYYSDQWVKVGKTENGAAASGFILILF